MKKLFTILLCLVMLVPFAACSKGAKYNVGVVQLVQHDALDAATQGFVDTLKAELGDDVFIDVQNGSGDAATCAVIAKGFVDDGYSLIMANATPALIAASNATSTIPVLGTSVTEYSVALNLDNFNGTIGTNVSGTSDLAPLTAQADMVTDLLPNAKTVGLLYCSGEPNSLYQVKVVRECLEKKGIKCLDFAFADSNDVQQVTTSACETVDAIYIPTDNTAASNGGVIAAVCNEKNIPIIAGEKGIMTNCLSVASYTINYYDLGVATAKMAIDILVNSKDVKTMPIQYCEELTKVYLPDVAEKYSVSIPSDYVAVILED